MQGEPILQYFSQGRGLIGWIDEEVVGISLVEEGSLEARDCLLNGLGLRVDIDRGDETSFYGTDDCGPLFIRICINIPYLIVQISSLRKIRRHPEFPLPALQLVPAFRMEPPSISPHFSQLPESS